MQNMIQFITQGATEFTPAVLVGLIVFSLTLECIGSIANSIFRGGR